MDTFDLHLLPHPDPSSSIEFAQVEIRINGTPLLDLIAKIEETPTQLEFEERSAAGEDPENLRITPGCYMYPTIGVILETEDLSFGKAQDHFQIEPYEDAFDSIALLGCECGEPSCWMILINSRIEGDVLTWSNFRQFHRPEWNYDLGPFHFELSKVEHELIRILSDL